MLHLATLIVAAVGATRPLNDIAADVAALRATRTSPYQLPVTSPAAARAATCHPPGCSSPTTRMGARRAGMRAEVFTTPAALATTLTGLGIPVRESWPALDSRAA
jgi:hypothetical protein